MESVDLPLADLTVCAADGNVFQRTAVSAHGVALEMGQDDHGVVIGDVAA